MAADAQILRHYGDTTMKDDVLSLIEYLTAEESSIHNMLGKTTAIATVHEVMTDSLLTAASGAVAEVVDYTMGTLTTPTRRVNLIENVAMPFSVSRTQQIIDHYHNENELVRQTTKALKQWHNSAEFDIVRSTLVSGVSGTAPKMSGLIEAISKSTNTTAQTSGTVWSASILKGLMKANWDNSNGDVATDLFMGSYLKNITDDFTNKTNVIADGVNEKRIVTAVDVFETGLGRVRVHTHRYVQQAGDTTGRVLALNPEKCRIAYLEKPYVDTGLARKGDYTSRAVVGKLTTEVRNQDSNWFAYGYADGT